jgi:hypothetical protein
MELCKKPYVRPAGDDAEWDDKNFIVDRDPGSLGGGLGELAVVMSGRYDQRQIHIYTDKHSQWKLGLDFRYTDGTHQVKTGIVITTGGAIVVKPAHFTTTADWIHLLGGGYWFMGRADDWRQVIDRFRQHCASYGEALPSGDWYLEPEWLQQCGIQQLPLYDWAFK